MRTKNKFREYLNVEPPETNGAVSQVGLRKEYLGIKHQGEKQDIASIGC
jgi:hypothetical protein